MTILVVKNKSHTCINDALTDDELRAILMRLSKEDEKDLFGMVCKRWLRLQSTERRKLKARAGPWMLRSMAKRFSGVIELDLSQSESRSFYPGVTDKDLEIIASGFQYLKILDLRNCKGITDTGMTTLGKRMSSLQSVDVSFCKKLSDKGFIDLVQGCSNLRRIHLKNCRLISDELLRALSKTCAYLEDLGLSGCSNVTDSGLGYLANGCRRIKSLDVSRCTKIGDDGVSNISRVCSSSIITLKLLDCYFVGDKSLFSLAYSCTNIETLVIGGCRNISDDSIKSIADSCKKSLKNLRMDWCTSISNFAISYILLNCENLVALDIGCCDNLTDVIFHWLEGANFEMNLKVLKASNCSGFTVSGIASLLKFCKHIQYLDVRSCPHITKLGCDQAGLVFPKTCHANFFGSLLDSDTTEPYF